MASHSFGCIEVFKIFVRSIFPGTICNTSMNYLLSGWSEDFSSANSGSFIHFSLCLNPSCIRDFRNVWRYFCCGTRFLCFCIWFVRFAASLHDPKATAKKHMYEDEHYTHHKHSLFLQPLHHFIHTLYANSTLFWHHYM